MQPNSISEESRETTVRFLSWVDRPTPNPSSPYRLRQNRDSGYNAQSTLSLASEFQELLNREYAGFSVNVLSELILTTGLSFCITRKALKWAPAYLFFNIA